MIQSEAVRIREPGGPEVLALGPLEVRDPGPGEVRVEVAAAGLNRADVLQRRGLYPAPPGVPADVPGLEFAGTVESAGTGAERWQPGERVMGITGGGAMARHVVVSAGELVPVPDALGLEEAAAVPEAFFTAWDACFRQAQLAHGERILVHAAASGVGTAALQLARAAGAEAIATSRTEAKLERCRELGAAHGILVGDGRFADAVLAHAPPGVDVVLDLVGAAYLRENARALAPKGRWVVLGLLGGGRGELDLALLLPKRVRLFTSVLRSRPVAEKVELAQAFRREVLPRFEEGRLRPVVDAVVPMEAVAEAQRRMERNATFGKIVLTWRHRSAGSEGPRRTA